MAMSHLQRCRRSPWIPVILALAAVMVLLIAPPTRTQPIPVSRPALSPLAEAAVRRMAAFYADIYSQPFMSTDRLPREIGILSLSRIDAPETTHRLLDVFSLKDHDPVIEYLAWEALHARHAGLDPKQRHLWIVAGLKAADNGAFPAATAAPLLRALTEENPIPLETEPRKLASRVIRENDLETPEGRETLNALRDLVAAWHEVDLARTIAVQLRTSELAHRVDFVLRGLPDAPPASAEIAKLPALWDSWLTAHARLAPAATGELKRYAGVATVFAKPDAITDPADKRWHAELEINKVTVSDFELAWCIDSTGSMAERNQRVASETRLLLHVCSLVSRHARCGTIYYRHETEADLMKPCCVRAKGNPHFYQVKGYPLTTDAKALATEMATEHIPKPDAKTEGNVHPGCAVHAALKAAMAQMNWSNDNHARRAIVLVGDSAPTPGSETAFEQLAAQAKAQRYIVEALVVGEAETTWEKALKAAGGQMFPMNALREQMIKAQDLAERRAIRQRAATNPSDPFADVMAEVLRQCVDSAYRDRVDPLLRILRPYAKAILTVEK